MSTGLPLGIDPALALIRFIKSKLGWGVQKEQVIVCQNVKCVENHKKKLDKFHKSFALYAGFGIFLGVVIIFSQLYVSKLTIQGAISGVVVALFVSCLSLFSYYPNVEGKLNA